MADVLISGYHGFKNSGDEALLFAILKTLKAKKPELDVTVLSKTPTETARVYEVRSISRYSPFQIIKEMKKTKVLLFGGGSLLQDVTSRKSIYYYLAILFLAECTGMKTMLYANGIGPITNKLSRFLAKHILNRVDVITLRDDRSVEDLKGLDVTKPKIIITADPAFTIDTDASLSGKYFTKRAGVPDNTRLCAVSIRDWKNLKDGFSDELARLLDYMAENHNIYPIFVPFQYPHDLEVSKSVMKKMNKPSYILSRELTVAEMFSVLSEAEITIGMRLHSLIYATTLTIPSMALVYDPKIIAFMESINQPDWVNAETFSFSDAKNVLDLLIENKQQKKIHLLETNSVLRKTAEENADYLIELLD